MVLLLPTWTTRYLSEVTRPALKLKPAFKSKLEEKVADQLTAAGVSFDYEGETVEFTVPSRTSRYTPDFPCGPTHKRIIIETKGRFGHMGSDGAKVRKHLALVKEQHPELDLRIVFQNAKMRIYKGSPTTYSKWAEDHGFKWSDKGIVPDAWIKEMKAAQAQTRKSNEHHASLKIEATNKKGTKAS